MFAGWWGQEQWGKGRENCSCSLDILLYQGFYTSSIMSSINLLLLIPIDSYDLQSISPSNMQIGVLTILAAFLSLAYAAAQYTLVKHPIQTGARCLDGTQAVLYYSLGSPQNRNKFMIYFNSGGLCTGLTLADTLQSCYKRSFTSLGSSANYKPTRTFQGEGLLSSNPTDNPVFWDWTRIYVPYCDGSEHQGSRLNPVSYKGRDLYFRGANNSMQQFQYLNQTFGLYEADKVVITGVSAGGIATYQWSNYLYERSKNKQVYALPDSGLFVVEYVSPFTGRANVIDAVSNLVQLMDSEVTFPIPECSVDFKDQPVMCFSAGNLVKYLKAKFFIIQSQYDQWSVQNILGLNCTGKTPGTLTNCNQSQIAAMQDYRRVTLQAIKNLTSLPNSGVWSPSCVQHGFSDDPSFNNDKYRIPTTTGIKLPEAIKAFLEDPGSGKHVYIDTDAWPSNKGCSGLGRPRNMMMQQ